ncbi:MAG: hypothetical protein PVF85_06620 [Anaerolineales bacterium]
MIKSGIELGAATFAAVRVSSRLPGPERLLIRTAIVNPGCCDSKAARWSAKIAPAGVSSFGAKVGATQIVSTRDEGVATLSGSLVGVGDGVAELTAAGAAVGVAPHAASILAKINGSRTPVTVLDMVLRLYSLNTFECRNRQCDDEGMKVNRKDIVAPIC